jgi:hypothetical protein
VVEKAPEASEVLRVERPSVLVTSMVMNVGASAPVNATPLTRVVFATVTDWLSGVKTIPLLLGVTV